MYPHARPINAQYRSLMQIASQRTTFFNQRVTYHISISLLLSVASAYILKLSSLIWTVYCWLAFSVSICEYTQRTKKTFPRYISSEGHLRAKGSPDSFRFCCLSFHWVLQLISLDFNCFFCRCDDSVLSSCFYCTLPFLSLFAFQVYLA